MLSSSVAAHVPVLVSQAGESAAERVSEFFTANIRNPLKTRRPIQGKDLKLQQGALASFDLSRMTENGRLLPVRKGCNQLWI